MRPEREEASLVLWVLPVAVEPVDRDLIEPHELRAGRFIMREPSSGTYRSAKRALAELAIDTDKLNVLLEVGASEAIALAVQEGLGVGFVSQMILQTINPAGVGTVRVRGLEMIQNIHFGRQTVQPATGAQAAFWEFIKGLDPPIFRAGREK